MSGGGAINTEWEVSVEDVRDRLAAGDETLLLLDCRRDDEVSLARIEPSVHVPMEEVHDRLMELEAHADREIVVYCHHGRRSLRVAVLLRQNGFDRVMSMAGGIDAWSERIDPSKARY